MGAEAMMSVGYMCLIISVWGSLQLFVMGFLYKIEAVTLYEDCEPESPYANYEEFIDQVKHNYAAVSTQCLIAAVVYLVFIVLSVVCIRVASEKMKQKAIKFGDDEIICRPTRFY